MHVVFLAGIGVFGDREDMQAPIYDSTGTNREAEAVKELLCPAVPYQHFLKLNGQTPLEKDWRKVLQQVQDLSAKVSEACLPLQRSKQILWIAGPPGAGKSTLGKRFQQYAFMVLDCEDKWAHGQLKPLIAESRNAQVHGQTAFVFPACYSQYLTSAPDFVIPVVLLPDHDVYTQRWKERERLWLNLGIGPDKQDHITRYKQTSEVAARLERDSPGHSVVLRQHEDECPDYTIYRICLAVRDLMRASM